MYYVYKVGKYSRNRTYSKSFGDSCATITPCTYISLFYIDDMVMSHSPIMADEFPSNLLKQTASVPTLDTPLLVQWLESELIFSYCIYSYMD